MSNGTKAYVVLDGRDDGTISGCAIFPLTTAGFSDARAYFAERCTEHGEEAWEQLPWADQQKAAEDGQFKNDSGGWSIKIIQAPKAE